MANGKENGVESAAEKQKRHRSPNYPMFNLEVAVSKAKSLFDEIKRHPVGADVVIGKLGYGSKSSSGMKAIAAMRAFGFLEDQKGTGDSTVRFSENGLDIVVDCREGSGAWHAAIRTAALNPAIHHELWNKYDGKLPLDEELRRYLVRVREHKFSDDAVDDFIDEFRKTIVYAKLGESDIIGSSHVGESGGKVVPKVGDFVQWVVQGENQFMAPCMVEGISEDGDWAFFPGSEVGAPMSELTISETQEDPNESDAVSIQKQKLPPRNPKFKPAKPVGPSIRFPLTDDNVFELRLDAKVSKEDFKRLKQLIELSEASLVKSE